MRRFATNKINGFLSPDNSINSANNGKISTFLRERKGGFGFHRPKPPFISPKTIFINSVPYSPFLCMKSINRYIIVSFNGTKISLLYTEKRKK